MKLLENPNTIDATEEDYLYVKTSQLINSGNGLFTAIDIYKDEVISIFKGEILNQAQAKQRADCGKDAYFINMINGSVMDSMHTPCFAKYANDAKGISEILLKNNSKIALDENNNVCIVATRNIKQGSEIFCSYGKRYWKKLKC